jgi:hypothetical protein
MIRKNNKVAALSLAKRGWAVFPCLPKDKTPATGHGFLDASANAVLVEKMFANADYNIGVATGPASGVWVLDLDGSDGIAALAQLEAEHGTLPLTVSQRTGGGGRQLFFRWNGIEVRNRTRIGGMSIDVRGNGGYAVVPPSIHPSGNSYEWERDPETTPIAEAPAWLIEFVTTKEQSSQSPQPLLLTVKGIAEDLTTAPGAPEGQRHATALRLVGSALGRGGDACQVAQQAVDWGRRCSPPIADDEVLKIVSDLSRKEGTRVAASRQEVEAEPLPEPIQWPTLNADAYRGLAGEIVQAIEPETEADPVAIMIQLLVSYGNLVGRKPHYQVEGTTHHANLFAVLVGSTARGRKGTSEGRVRQILRFVDEDWSMENVKTGLVSGEGLIWSVRDAIYKMEHIKEKGRIVGNEEVLADAGIADKRLLVVESEFASVLRVCRREQNTLSPTMRSAWDTGHLRTLAKNSPAKATGAHISIIGHITTEELHRALAEVDGFNGFCNRFLWVVVHRSKLLPDGGKDLDLSPYAARLSTAIATATAVERMRRDQDAAALWRRSYAELADDDAHGLLAAVTSRAEAQVLRLSIVYALIDGSGTIREQHLRAALAVWRYCRESAAIIFGQRSGDPLAEKILETIRQQPGIGRREIHQATGNHVKAATLVNVLAKLRDAGRVRVEKVETAGRPAERWFTCEQSELSEQSTANSSATPQEKALCSLSSLNSQAHRENDAGMEVIEI